MTALLTLARRELAGHFFSLRGYVIMAEYNCCSEPACSRWCICSTDWRMIAVYEKISANRILLAVLLMVALIPCALLLTKARGTFETPMTTPVSDIQVVLAKFIGSYVFFLIAFLPTVVYPFLLEHYAHRTMQVDSGAVWSLAWESVVRRLFHGVGLLRLVLDA